MKVEYVAIAIFFIILVSIQFTLNRLLYHVKEILNVLQLLVNRSK